MIIKVTQEHIDQGKIEDILQCPVARALRGCGLRGVVVECESFEYLRGDEKHLMVFPAVVQEAIHSYDNLQGMEPFEFELDIFQGEDA